ncbi:PPOX class F420-dependent oxidoreductase [Rhodococcus triatomae]|uniref:Pyridoxamine 5'-phosphate oxidase N-terminal domain-containing protein n=1 Tax=Rhodococcus triatomae TaxID=300028 RepID=A0A1G8DSL3_9NOCA|nr:PPOX class F420-dependent oxidoreductase [Rhodococcus triatomae]QNG18354.1 PPOX class F420-dependent oxidoreductase [Rhodococcus triatomae]QNG21976.1 PPOX class F420-dependent oxidoreductase [Rhodococcus triatomae]SDH60687.1 hypothetical protein SAMN05444695_102396 [Rhodococcus triatomae]
MEHMSEPEWHEFVLAGTRTAKVATVRADGRPHVAPVWFTLDTHAPGGTEVVFSTGEKSVKGRNLARDPRVSICVDDQEPPFGFVILTGEAVFDRDPDALLTWATRLGSRYMGEEAGAEFGRRNAVPGELLVRVRVAGVVAERDLTG